MHVHAVAYCDANACQSRGNAARADERGSLLHAQTEFTPVLSPEEGFTGVMDTMHGGLEVPKHNTAGTENGEHA